MTNPIKLSSGNRIRVDPDGRAVFGNSIAHTRLLLLLLARPEGAAEADEIASPWLDRPEVRSGQKSRDLYLQEVYEGIDLVPPETLQLVIDELLASGRRVKPGLREIQNLCLGALRIAAETKKLTTRASRRQ